MALSLRAYTLVCFLLLPSASSQAGVLKKCWAALWEPKLTEIKPELNEQVRARAKAKIAQIQSHLGCTLKVEKNRQLDEITAFDSQNAEMGYIQYTVGTNTLKIRYIESHVVKKDVATLLLAKALEINPHVTRIQGYFTETNYEVYARALARGAKPLAAAKLTPAYKIRKALGFSKIAESSEFGPDEITLITEWDDDDSSGQ